MTRFAHVMHRNRESRWPRYVTFYDVESDVLAPRDGKQYFNPFLWVACHVEYRKDDAGKHEVWESNEDPAAFWTSLENRTYEHSTRYVVSHHVEPDFLPLGGLTELPRLGWTLQHSYRKMMTVILRWEKRNQKLVFINNAQLLPGSIESWGKLLTLPKLQMPSKEDPLPAWVTYCKRDVEIMVESWYKLKEFISEHNLGGFGITRSSLAKHAFQHRFLTHKVYVHNNEDAIRLERRGYFGGRCEALQYGTFSKGPYYLLDVNGMYAHVTIENLLPTKLLRIYEHPDMQTVKRALLHDGVLADVMVRLKEPIAPVKTANGTTYPVGYVKTTLNTPELTYALDREWDVEVRKMVTYTLRPLLRDFATYFAALKAKYEQEGNGLFRELAKGYPNLVYGKFGQKGIQTTIVGECKPDLLWWMSGYDTVKDVYYDLLYSGGKIKRLDYTLAAWDTFVAVASHVTAYARMYLWELMKRAGLHNVYHVATDSLIVNQAGYDQLKSLVDPHNTGSLKVELKGSTLNVYGKNDWKLDQEARVKGVQKKAKWLAEDRAVNTIWPSMTGWLKGINEGPYFVYDQVKTLKREQYHETVGYPAGDYPRVAPDAERPFRLVSPQVMLTLWDYKKSDWRRVRSRLNRIEDQAHAKVDEMATELGFADGNALRAAVQQQLWLDQHQSIERKPG